MKTKNKKTLNIGTLILRVILPYHTGSSALGDYEEIYNRIVEQEGKFKALIWFWTQIIKSIFPFIASTIYWRMIMLKNYIKTAFRNIKRYKGYSFINITGLAIGMTCSILILLWVQNELSFDKFHDHSKNLHRIDLVHQQYGRIPMTALPMGPAFVQELPKIIQSARFSQYKPLIQKDNDRFYENGAFVDPTFFQMFTFPLMQGNINTVFSEPNSIVLTEELSQKYYGTINPIGKSLKVDGKNDFQITGVIKNVPNNSHLQFDFLVPFENFVKSDREPENWGRIQIFTYVLLQEKHSEEYVNRKITEITISHLPEWDASLALQPITRIHLYDPSSSGGVKYVTIFSILAIFILLIASINFMNLTTARSSVRNREIGMRKVSGAKRGNLIVQFMGESIFLSFISFLFAIIFVYFLLPIFNNISGAKLSLSFLDYTNIIWALIGFVLVTGIFSGSYPALFLSSLKSLNIISGVLPIGRNGKRNPIFRRLLVIFQFSISIILIISTFIISKQLSYIRNKNLGYVKEQVLYLKLKGNIQNQSESVLKELLRDPNILSGTLTSELPTGIYRNYNSFEWEGKDPGQKLDMNLVSVNHNFFKTLEIEFDQGRSFSEEFSTDEDEAFILNETAIKKMDLESPIGKQFSFPDRNGLRKGTIIGVVKDFHFDSFHYGISPLAIISSPDRFGYICLRLGTNSSDLSNTISHIENIWNKIAPEFLFEYHFLDETFDAMYRTEQRFGKIFEYFSFLAIFISCLGLFGLAAYIAEQRTKEIGIRKVLGASVPGIVTLLSKEFIKWVFVANVIAWPIAWYVMNSWLKGFVYHTQINLDVFLFSALLAMIIAIFTVGFQTTKAAIVNPINSLKYE